LAALNPPVQKAIVSYCGFILSTGVLLFFFSVDNI